MTHPVLLIAGREFRTYAGTASFWIALAVGPMIMGGALALTGGAKPPPPSASLVLHQVGAGDYEARFSKGFPVDPAGRAALVADIRKGLPPGSTLKLQPERRPKAVDADAVSRFGLVMMLWMTLTGSLGMLLQAVVRERTNRALESLMSAASAVDIVAGKLAGVGAVSLVVIGAWLGSALAAAGLGAGPGVAGAVLRGLGRPELLAQAALTYVLAFLFYGAVTIAIGARARDTADAQNLSRPMFALLLAVFFIAMAAAGGVRAFDPLVWAAPFTPFLILLKPAPAEVLIPALLALFLAGSGAICIAARSLRIEGPTFSLRRVKTLLARKAA